MFNALTKRHTMPIANASDDKKSSDKSPRQEPDSDFLDWLASLLGLKRPQNPQPVLAPVPVPVRIPRRVRR